MWVRPAFAFVVVIVVAVVILGILVAALLQLHVFGTVAPGQASAPPVADPNAGTIAALAGSALTALTSLTATYFGVKVASEQTSQARATTAQAMEALRTSAPANGGTQPANGGAPPGT